MHLIYNFEAVVASNYSIYQGLVQVPLEVLKYKYEYFLKFLQVQVQVQVKFKVLKYKYWYFSGTYQIQLVIF